MSETAELVNLAANGQTKEDQARSRILQVESQFRRMKSIRILPLRSMSLTSCVEATAMSLILPHPMSIESTVRCGSQRWTLKESGDAEKRHSLAE